MAEYTLLYGQFVIRYPDLPKQGPEPDGDTMKFAPADQDLVWKKITRRSGRPPKINRRGISVRLEAIDALETHFNGTHQELDGGEKARDTLLAKLGFTNIKYWGEHLHNKIQSADQDSLPGFVLSNGIDANGRLIGFVYSGNDGPGEDGATVTVDNKLIDKSVNTKLLSDGLAFPAFYGTLPSKLRDHLVTKSKAARTAGKGILPRATGLPKRPAEVTDLESLTISVIWPKLSRRLVVFLKETGPGLEGFEAWLREDGVDRDDKMFRLDTKENVRFHDILTIKGDTIALTVQPEVIVIEPDPADGSGR
ncbi:nuclease [Glarea lozoyensis ATCC 20868]|uniref:Probable endonuclease LCL3 n=1 Tax=Glarea lozoyensis (strain ATCC 20868 / MF5171) TaxID=1116229 RepID=S3CKE6_GLAL2|nr:nuclease [Glarea lozoyensis ATCC 20868]EPE26215.1 nuclease [Glarea lozoyensis ATCC 20868]